VSALFNQKEEPRINVDFMIIDKIAKEGKGDPFKKIKARH
jgi:hypothetical protein